MTTLKRVNLGSLADLGEGEKRSLEAADTQVMVCRVRGTLYAVEDRCSHADNALCPGRLSGYMITCPVHSARFDVRSGAHEGPPAFTGIRSFAIEESPAGAVLEIAPSAPPETSFDPV
ncbi:MAG: Rieske 2Fe-2S domain-containing protein [Gammaproteobacteria bacterium]|nr:Rieske 2Fe-2S domain-containing protein [Gammaproteobacteria bacterium]